MCSLRYYSETDYGEGIRFALYAPWVNSQHAISQYTAGITSMGQAMAPGRYHKAIVLPSPRITAGVSSIPLIKDGKFLTSCASWSKLAPCSKGDKDSSSLIMSIPHWTMGVMVKEMVLKEWLRTRILICSNQHNNQMVHANHGVNWKIKQRLWQSSSRLQKCQGAKALAHVTCYSFRQGVVSQERRWCSHGKMECKVEWCRPSSTHLYSADVHMRDRSRMQEAPDTKPQDIANWNLGTNKIHHDSTITSQKENM